MRGATLIARGVCSAKKLCGFFAETDFAATDGCASSLRGLWSPDDEGQPSASTRCSAAPPAFGFSIAMGAEGVAPSGPALGDSGVSCFGSTPVKGPSVGCNESSPFFLSFMCDDLRALYSC